MGVGSGVRKELTIADLVAAAANEQAPVNKKAARARKLLLNKIQKGTKIELPLAPAQAARAERKVAAAKADEEISKWTAAVKALREAPTLDFRQQGPQQNRRTIAAVASELKPETDLEVDINTMLEAAGVFGGEANNNDNVESTIHSIVDPQETEGDKTERQSRIAKLRRLMFYQEQKAKRLRKIKSKAYHKVLRKSAASKVSQQSGDVSLDREDRVASLLEEERRRAEERLTLKHKNTSRWSRRAIRKNLGRFNKGVAEALTEQNRIASNLTSKRRGGVSNADTGGEDDESELSDVSTGSDDEKDDEERSKSAITKALKSVANGESGLKMDDAKDSSGLMRLPFMKRSAERRDAQIVMEAQSLLKELEEQDDDDDDDENGAGEGRRSKKPNSQLGRLAFGDGMSESNWNREEDELPTEKEADDDPSPNLAPKRKSKRSKATSVPSKEGSDNRVASDFLNREFDPVTVEVYSLIEILWINLFPFPPIIYTRILTIFVSPFFSCHKD